MTNEPFFVSQLLGFPASVKPQYIDTSLFPGGSIRISLRLSPATAQAQERAENSGSPGIALTELTKMT